MSRETEFFYINRFSPTEFIKPRGVSGIKTCQNRPNLLIFTCFGLVSEVLPTLFGRHQVFLLDDLRRWRTFGMESEFEVVDDPVNDLMIFDKSDGFHFCTAFWTDEGIGFIDFVDHLCSAFGGHMMIFFTK